MDLSQSELIDRISAYCWEHKYTHKEGHEIEYSAVAMDDIQQTFDEFMAEGDFFRVISNDDCSNVEEKHILQFEFEKYKTLNKGTEIYNSGDYLLYFNFQRKTMTIFEVGVYGEKEPIIKRAKIETVDTFKTIMNSIGFRQ